MYDLTHKFYKPHRVLKSLNKIDYEFRNLFNILSYVKENKYMLNCDTHDQIQSIYLHPRHPSFAFFNKNLQ